MRLSQIAESKYKEITPENNRDHWPSKKAKRKQPVLQISYLLVVILELNSVSEVQYNDIIITDDEKYQQE